MEDNFQKDRQNEGNRSLLQSIINIEKEDTDSYEKLLTRYNGALDSLTHPWLLNNLNQTLFARHGLEVIEASLKKLLELNSKAENKNSKLFEPMFENFLRLQTSMVELAGKQLPVKSEEE